jgi:hypothetical protein
MAGHQQEAYVYVAAPAAWSVVMAQGPATLTADASHANVPSL